MLSRQDRASRAHHQHEAALQRMLLEQWAGESRGSAWVEQWRANRLADHAEALERSRVRHRPPRG